MATPRWKLSDLLLVVLACGVALAAYRNFWQPPPNPNARPYLSAYLTLVATATLGSFFSWPRWRRPFQGFALYGWCHLVFVMWGGFKLTTLQDAEEIVKGAQIGAVFGVLSALLAVWFLEPPGQGRGNA